jgi:ABC-type multidrug transport system fused ATPase/permease subunit
VRIKEVLENGLNNLKRNNMSIQLIVTILLALAIIFIPYFIGRLIPNFTFETVIHSWILGFISLILSGAAIGTLILMGKGLWITAGHLLGNF